MDAMYRRGESSRRKQDRFPPRERRRLFQLGASAVLFLVVFVGRGILPDRMETVRVILGTDMDFREAVATFERVVAESGVLGALDVLRLHAAETGIRIPSRDPFSPRTQLQRQHPGAWIAPGKASQDTEQESIIPEVDGLPDASPNPADSADPEADGVPDPPEAAVADRPAVAAAAAQQYNDAGEKLPENISLQYYDLGLAETAVPVLGTVTSGFGFRDHPVNGAYTFHNAVDIGVSKGTDVLAFAAGTVRYIGESDIYGLYVRLDHDNNVSTFYAHCQELLVHQGDTVACGQVIAKSGETGNATGPHLHFSIDKDGIRLDPAYYLE